MNYRITRETFDPYTNDSLGNFGPYTQYKIWKEEELLGEFYYKNITSYFYFSGEEFRIISERRSLRKYFSIIDREKNTLIASFTKSLWRYWLKNEIGCIHISGKKYECTRSSFQVIENPLFKSEQKIAISFSLKSESDLTSFSMIYNVMPQTDPYLYKPTSDFSGQIFSTANNITVLFAGLFLIERFLNY